MPSWARARSAPRTLGLGTRHRQLTARDQGGEREHDRCAERVQGADPVVRTDLLPREIGAALFVSFNIVKSRTRTRKLGVWSRADLVERGREFGLL